MLRNVHGGGWQLPLRSRLSAEALHGLLRAFSALFGQHLAENRDVPEMDSPWLWRVLTKVAYAGTREACWFFRRRNRLWGVIIS